MFAGAETSILARHVTLPPGLPLWAGCIPQIFPCFLGGVMNDQLKLQKELHSVVLGLLRQGFTLQSVIHALIVESEKMSESAAVVQAINEFDKQP